MFKKAKAGVVLSAIAAALSVASVGSVFAASADQSATKQEQPGAFKGNWGNHKGEPGKLWIVKGFGLQDNTELLTLLKLDAEKLQTELKAGKSLAELAEAQGVSTDDVIALLTEQREKQLAEAVTSGKLTQEQADKMKERLADDVKRMVEDKHDGKGMGKVLIKGFGFHDNAELLSLLKLDAEKLQTELKAGKSLAEVAKAQGVSTDKVIALLTEQHEKQLAEAVTNGNLTQEQADKMKEHLAEGVTHMVENNHDGKHFGRGFGKGFFMKENADLLALLKLDAEGLQTELKAGKSLAEVAKAQGVSTDDVVALLTEQREKHLAEAVANGKLTQEQADQMKARLAEEIKQFVEHKFDGKRGEKEVMPKQ